ncbi:MAG: hypothetical protein WBD31_27070 [Rubripirellula sp.]
MKTQPKHPRTLAAICSVVALCAASITTANAQTSSGVSNGLFTHGNDSFRVVNTAGYRTAADSGMSAAGTVQQVGHLGQCTSCGTSCGGSCGGGTSMGVALGYSDCGSCGTACGGTCGRQSMLSCGPKNMNPCQPCSPYRYGSVEALYMAPNNDNYTSSPNFGLGDYDYEFGSRITLGVVGDCIHGYEASFTGPFEWDLSRQISAAGGINSYLTTGSPAAAMASFTDATFQQQTLSAEYYSLEASKTLVGWEMAKLLIGGRYINYDEDYSYTSRTAASGNGQLRSQTQNDLIGLQVGMDLLYPISRHGYSDVRARAGAYYNSYDTSVSVFDAGTLRANGSDDGGELAGMFELSTGVRYQLGEILSVRAGVELWYLSGVASATEQFSTQISDRTGRGSNADDDILFTGVSVGAELRY